MSNIIPISLAPLGFLNVYLLRGSKTILIDTGLKGSGKKILDAMSQHEVRPEDISLILLTHGHADHVGSTAELKASIDAPVAIGRADAPRLEQGQIAMPTAITKMGTILRLVLGKDPTFPPCKADILIDEGFDLASYGVSGRIVAVPGHSPGMVAILTEDNDTIAGDTLAGQPFAPREPSVAYLQEDRAQAAASLQKLVSLKPRRYYVGHGGPFAGEKVEKWVEQGGGQ